jgi:hypothetical protein
MNTGIDEKPKTIGLDTGLRWRCRVCIHRQEPIDGEEWPYHCKKVMELRAWVRFVHLEEVTT